MWRLTLDSMRTSKQKYPGVVLSNARDSMASTGEIIKKPSGTVRKVSNRF